MVVRTHADRIQYAPSILLCLVLFGCNMPSIVKNGKLSAVRSKANNCILHVTIGMLFLSFAFSIYRLGYSIRFTLVCTANDFSPVD